MFVLGPVLVVVFFFGGFNSGAVTSFSATPEMGSPACVAHQLGTGA
jgi:hypothetical protein